MKEKTNLRLALFGGAGIGLQLGVLMGMTLAPSVANVLSVLAGILAATLGLNDKHFNNTKAARIGAFGFACVFGAYFGLFVRTHNLLSPSLTSLKSDYKEVGFSDKQSLNLIAIKEFGKTLAEVEASVERVPSYVAVQGRKEGLIKAKTSVDLDSDFSSVNQQHSSLLFASQSAIDICDELSNTDESLALDDILNNFNLTGGLWQDIATELPKMVQSSLQKTALLASKQAICSVHQYQYTFCRQMIHINKDTSYAEAMNMLRNVNPEWRKFTDIIDSQNRFEQEKMAALSLVTHSFCGF